MMRHAPYRASVCASQCTVGKKPPKKSQIFIFARRATTNMPKVAFFRPDSNSVTALDGTHLWPELWPPEDPDFGVVNELLGYLI